MQAIVTIAGSQYRVKQDDTIVVPLLSDDVDSTLEFDIMMSADNDTLGFGGGKVTAKVLEHGKSETVLVFHKKRRKGYQKLNGHRQRFTRLKITGISI